MHEADPPVPQVMGAKQGGCRPPCTPSRIALVVKGELDPVLALGLVVWPRKDSRLEDEQVPPRKQFYSDELREEIRVRHAAGESIPQLALKTGVPFGQVKVICSSAGAKRGQAELTLF
jgi:hypothetical protein